jgi:hypothetical protein
VACALWFSWAITVNQRYRAYRPFKRMFILLGRADSLTIYCEILTSQATVGWSGRIGMGSIP